MRSTREARKVNLLARSSMRPATHICMVDDAMHVQIDEAASCGHCDTRVDASSTSAASVYGCSTWSINVKLAQGQLPLARPQARLMRPATHLHGRRRNARVQIR